MDTDDKTTNARTERHMARWASVMDRLAEGPTNYGPHDTEQVCAALERLCDERDRLRRVLAVERGDESLAPEGWRLQHDYDGYTWLKGDPYEGYPSSAVDLYTGCAHNWAARDGDDVVVDTGEAPSALEAMEAADAAMEASRGH